jgi:hypothetical protein
VKWNAEPTLENECGAEKNSQCWMLRVGQGAKLSSPNSQWHAI